MSEALIAIRPARPEDIPFIYSSWLKSYKHGSNFGKSTRSTIFFENYREIIDEILISANIVVACLPEDANVILGYLVHDGSVFHYCFIKQTFRRMGLASMLKSAVCATDPVVYTHETNILKEIDTNKRNMEYNPFLLYKK